jgi:hypothetical protein
MENCTQTGGRGASRGVQEENSLIRYLETSLSSFCFHGTLLIFCELSPKRRGRLGKMHFYVIYPLTRGVNKGEKTMAGLTLKHIYKVYPGKVNNSRRRRKAKRNREAGTSLQSRISIWKFRTGNLSSSSDLRVAVSLRRFV